MRLPPAARNLIERLLCDVDDRLGTAGGAAEIKVVPYCAPAGVARSFTLLTGLMLLLRLTASMIPAWEPFAAVLLQR